MTLAPAPYALISPEGDLTIGERATDMRALLGPEGPARVRLDHGLAGWVNDDGYALGLPRNIVGSLMLVGWRAAFAPYAGPIVVTGWEPVRELAPLGRRYVQAMRVSHADARRAAGLDDSPPICPPQVFAHAQQLAAALRAAETPRMTFHPLPDLAAGFTRTTDGDQP